MSYAQDTEVSVSKSRLELERTLERYGATHFGYISGPDKAMVQFVCKGKAVRFVIPIPDKSERRFTHHSRGWRTPEAAAAEWEQGCRRCWRAMNLVVKAKLEAVESRITTFEEEFLAHIVMPNGQTYGEWAIPQVTLALQSDTMPPLALPQPQPKVTNHVQQTDRHDDPQGGR